MSARVVCVVALAIMVASAACGSARRSAALGAPPVPATAEILRGQRVFMRACHACHPGGETGLGPSLNDKPLPGFMIALQVRRGLGAMPAFSREELPDDELAALVEYMRARRGR
jgi:mono/diheme cytochrome c family protein